MKAKILVIEDNEQNLYLTTFIMVKNGYQVIQARNGVEGIKKASQEKPDLIILDIQLPLLDGYEVVRRLKKNPETSNIPIIAVTSYAMTGDREKILDSGCSGYIEKPINPDTFLEQVKGHLQNFCLED